MKSAISSPSSLLLVLVFFGIISSCSEDGIQQYEDIQELVNLTVSRENIPGMIAAIIDSTGILQIESAGVRKMGSLDLVSLEDHFHLGSCTKAMTSALIATLIADNQLQWETTLIEVFPDLKDTIHQDYHHITIHQLLTHRAGLEKDPSDLAIQYGNPDIKDRRYLYMIDILKEPNQIIVGTYHYSNLGYCIAAVMAERITGLSWEVMINDRIFEPLGMGSAGFGPPGTSGQIDQPWGHHKEDGKWVSSQLDNVEEIGPAGRIHCSIQDWARFLALLLKQDDTSILERDQLDKLIEPIGDYACGWWVVQRDWGNGNVLTHGGSNTMWYVSVWIAPEINRAFIVGTNSHDSKTIENCDNVMGWLISIDRNN